LFQNNFIKIFFFETTFAEEKKKEKKMETNKSHSPMRPTAAVNE